MCPTCSCNTDSILCAHWIDWLKLNKDEIGSMCQLKEAGFLLQLTACESLAKILWNHEGSSEFS